MTKKMFIALLGTIQEYLMDYKTKNKIDYIDIVAFMTYLEFLDDNERDRILKSFAGNKNKE